MNIKQLADEFKFLRYKLEEIADSVSSKNYTKATFMIGCLHNICHGHFTDFSKLHTDESVKEEKKNEQPPV
jgi:hypothetical protein